ncbi:hypothetical protein [Longimicrobium sp.]|uniref:hypothetical protein n=1 Tax=Longimicrobium sp. TaxID=2029185 RepID=UPI002C2B6F93|nr:hypothetical protein [Longimicrobium sp.]HSU14138.1 hypothetical protein [Longimicrobium sp.]
MAPAPDPSLQERAAEAERLRDELAGVARQIARLLVQPRYDEAELAELDVRARDLRQQLARAMPPHDVEGPPELRLPVSYGGGLVSGG